MAGITNTVAVGTLCEFLGLDGPIVAVPNVNPPLARHPTFRASLRQLRETILDAVGVPAATDAWESSQYRTDRAVDSLYATAEEVLHVYGNERVSASTDGHDLDLDGFLSGDNTIYLYAPAHQQRLSDPCSRRSPSRS